MPSLTPVEMAEKSLKTSRMELAKNGANAVEKSSQMMFKTFEDSLKLFVKSIEYQDPMDPVDTSEMAKQMFQLSQAQGQHAMVEKMTEQNELLKTGQALNAASLIGKTLEVNSDKFALAENKSAQLGIYMPENVHHAKMEIRDDKGGVVFEKELTPKALQSMLEPGKHELVWNGEVTTDYGKHKSAGKNLVDGQYRLVVKAYDKQNQVIKEPWTDEPKAIQTTIKAPMTGSDFMNNTPKITVGNNTLPLSAIVSIQGEDKAPVVEPFDRLAALKDAMSLLSEEDQKVILDNIAKEAKATKKMDREDRKLEKMVNNLKPEQYESITKEITNKLNIEN
ncbi:MAG: hypothetical protein KBB83_04225 [Alphaproteobacteria bacterium]|nr:hypothetical protein [Alphaproteobacteria bacterium]